MSDQALHFPAVDPSEIVEFYTTVAGFNTEVDQTETTINLMAREIARCHERLEIHCLVSIDEKGDGTILDIPVSFRSHMTDVVDIQQNRIDELNCFVDSAVAVEPIKDAIDNAHKMLTDVSSSLVSMSPEQIAKQIYLTRTVLENGMRYIDGAVSEPVNECAMAS